MKRVLIGVEGSTVFLIWIVLLILFVAGSMGNEFYLEDVILLIVYGDYGALTETGQREADALNDLLVTFFDEDFYLPVLVLLIGLSLVYGTALFAFRSTFFVSLLWLALRLGKPDRAERSAALCRVEICGWIAFGLLIVAASATDGPSTLLYLLIAVLPNALAAALTGMPIGNALFRKPGDLADGMQHFFVSIRDRLGEGPSAVFAELAAWTAFCLVAIAMAVPDLPRGFGYSLDTHTLAKEMAYRDNLQLVIVLSILGFVLTYLMVRRELPLSDLVRNLARRDDADAGREHILVRKLRDRAGQLRTYALIILGLMVTALVVAVSIFVLAESFGSKQDARAVIVERLIRAEENLTEHQDDFLRTIEDYLSKPQINIEQFEAVVGLIGETTVSAKSIGARLQGRAEMTPADLQNITGQLTVLSDRVRDISKRLTGAEAEYEKLIEENAARVATIFNDYAVEDQMRAFRDVINDARDSVATISGQMQRDFWNDRSFVESLVTRFGALIILFTAVQILGGRYESLLNRAAEYDAMADSLSLAVTETPEALKDLTLQEIIDMTRVQPLRTKQAITPVDRLLDGLQNVAMAFGSVKTATEQTIRNVRRRGGGTTGTGAGTSGTSGGDPQS